jgi:CRISPR/Cas system-associated exonuclease Cas4 (RecB family)
VDSYSFSAISSFKTCPKSFEYKYIKKIKEAFFSIESYMGTSVHETLKWAYEQKQKNIELQIDDINNQYKYFWDKGSLLKVKVIKINNSIEDYFNQGFELLTSYFQRVFCSDKSESLHLEHKFEIFLDKHIKYRGVIDRISKTQDKVIRITDFKTGKVSHPLKTLQLPSYALYVFENNLDTKIELSFEDLKEKREIIAPFCREDGKEIRSNLIEEITRIKNTNDFKTQPSVLCMWCGYNKICKNPHDSVKSTLNSKNLLNSEDEYGKCCPKCGEVLVKREGKFGAFMGCSDFPECKYTLDLKEFKSKAIENEDAEKICPEW